MAVVHYIVESYSGYEAIKNSLDGNCHAVWHTTSPYLLEYLPKEGQEVYSLESGLPQELLDKLAVATYEFADDFCNWLNATCHWRKSVDLKSVLHTFVTHFFHTTFYKGLLLDKLRLDNPNETVVCVGDIDNIDTCDLNPRYKKFDTVYAFIANYCTLSDISVFQHKIPQYEIDELVKSIVYPQMQVYEKILSLINNTFGSFCYKVWKWFYSKKIYPFNHIGLTCKPKKNIYIFKDCELITEIFPSLLFQGGHIGMVSSMPGLKVTEVDVDSSLQKGLFKEKCFSIIDEKLSGINISLSPVYDACIDLFFKRMWKSVELLRINFDHLFREFGKITKYFRPNSMVLTVELSTPVERLFYFYCKENKIGVVASEHGVTHGISKWSTWGVRLSGMAVADFGLYHNQLSLKAFTPHAPAQRQILVGLPKVTTKIYLKGIQKFLARKILNIQKNKKIVLYIADLDRNNEMYGPYGENCLQFQEKTRDIIRYLAGRYPNRLIVVKLYPSQNYLDEYNFENIAAEFNNVMIVKNIDFRFIRAMADKIYVSSIFSTLGWVAGSGVPYDFLEFDWSPLLLDGRKREETPAITGLKRLMEVDDSVLNQPLRTSRLLALLEDD